MAALGKLRTIEGNRLMFFCPGCNDNHVISIDAGRWSWNGDGERPTFAPSVLVTSGHYLHGDKPGNCYCDFAERHPDAARDCKWKCIRCHSFVRDGRIEFLSDSTHELAGQTVDLPVHPENV